MSSFEFVSGSWHLYGVRFGVGIGNHRGKDVLLDGRQNLERCHSALNNLAFLIAVGTDAMGAGQDKQATV